MEHEIYYAKSKRSDGSQPTVPQHLDAVSGLAAEYGAPAGIREEARLAGLLHDFGKYSDAFQDLLAGKKSHVDHAVCGAVLLWRYWKGKVHGNRRSVLEAINGHHAGLTEYEVLEQLLRSCFAGTPYLTVNDGKTPALNGAAEYQKAHGRFSSEHPDERFALPAQTGPETTENLEMMLYTRMLLSCLVDADYSVSAWEDDPDYFRNTEAPALDTAEGLKNLYAFRESIQKNSDANSGLNQLRNLVFERCGGCGEQEAGGLFTLTAPTGIGKTLALLHFALKHAQATGKRRIVIVLPFLTLAEQNAAVYEQIMPSVLVDHSQSRLPEEMREFTAKWNAPFIITTSVKFFEALFAREPSDCRKLHNLAQSVVVFDEAQSLPPQLTGTTLQAVNELCRRYQMTMVFSTATQPDFDAIPVLNWKPREILPEHGALYRKLRRVNVEWQLEQRTPLEQIGAQMLEQSSVCGIFNLRRHARTVFRQLREADPGSAFLISTDLCPAHRTQVIARIRERLGQGKSCRVAATQCIEAGVDLDFGALYRALAPLDSIIQAAGRCNRNGKKEQGNVTIFEPADIRRYPDEWYQNAAAVVREMVSGSGLDINDPADIGRYYRRLLSGAVDKAALTNAIRDRNYQQVADQYRLIPNAGEKLIVPYSGLQAEYAYIRAEVLEQGITPGLMKQAAPLTITVFDQGHLERYAERIMTRSKGRSGETASGYWVLRRQYENCYSDEGGLCLPEEKVQKGHTDFLF